MVDKNGWDTNFTVKYQEDVSKKAILLNNKRRAPRI